VQTGYGWLGTAVLEGELEVTMPDGSVVVYIPSNIHFHSPSEHTFNGKQYDLEMHIVHINKKTRQLGAVIGILFDRTKKGDTEFLQSLNLERATDPEHVMVIDEDLQTGFYKPDQPVAFEKFLNNLDLRRFYNYEGSLTTPPCTEGLHWFVMENVEPVTYA
jgi:carbonic anhydrase